MIPHRDTLLNARKLYSKCANKVEKTIKTQGFTDELSARIIGIGIAAEWTRRAAEMDNIHYMGENLNKSRRSELFVELLRFNFSWFALNAIFTRYDLLSLFGEPSNESEYSAFKLLYESAMLPNELTRLQKLRLLLNTEIETRLPISSNDPDSTPQAINHRVSTLQAIYCKYLLKRKNTCGRDIEKPSGQTAKNIEKAVKERNINLLDMPTLLYAFRNWSVHGNTLHGCFGSRPRFYEYTCLLQETLAHVHYATANRLIGLL